MYVQLCGIGVRSDSFAINIYFFGNCGQINTYYFNAFCVVWYGYLRMNCGIILYFKKIVCRRIRDRTYILAERQLFDRLGFVCDLKAINSKSCIAGAIKWDLWSKLSKPDGKLFQLCMCVCVCRA